MDFLIPRNQQAVQGLPVNKYLTRAEFPSASRGLFSATSPVLYSSTTGVFSFDTATTVLTAYAQKTNNLSDLSDAATARTNLGLVAGGAGDIWVEKAGDTITGTLNITPSSDVSALIMQEFSASPTGPIFQVKRSDGTARWSFNKTTLNSNTAVGINLIFDTSSAVSPSTGRTGLSVTLNAGFTGSAGGLTGALAFDNQVAGVDTTITADSSTGFNYRVGGNRGITGFARGSTVGYNTGVMVGAGLGLFNFAGWLTATANKTNTTNVGTFSTGWTTSSGGTYVGGYFTNRNQAGLPTFESAALIADNDNTSAPIFLARDNGTKVFQILDFGNFISTQQAASSGVVAFQVWTAVANTGRTASTEVINFNFNSSATQTWAAGAITTQREAVVQAPTYAFVSASTITTAATWTITGAPIAGTNATITNSLALWVQAGLARFDGTAAVKSGTSTAFAKIGGVIVDHSADAGNSGTSETDLYSDSIIANTFGTNNDKVLASYGGIFVSSATATRQIKIYFAGTVILDTGALSISASSSWGIDIYLHRVSSTVVRYRVALQTAGASTAVYNAEGELTGLTLSNANTLKITGTAAGVGAATNDIVAKQSFIEFKPAA